MKNILVFFIVSMLLGTGVYDAFRQKRKTRILDEILRFILLVKSEISYRAPDVGELLDTAQKQGFRYLYFNDLQVDLHESCDVNVKNEFFNFYNRIGTTDISGQISLCNEFFSSFSELQEARKRNEKSKIQVNTALSVLSALCVIIFSL